MLMNLYIKAYFYGLRTTARENLNCEGDNSLAVSSTSALRI